MVSSFRSRPETLDDIVGQEAALKIVRNVLAMARRGVPPHPLFLVGPAGTGKTSTARAIVRDLNPEAYLWEVDCSQKGAANEVVERLQGLAQPGLNTDHDGPWLASEMRVIILDEFNQFTESDRLKVRKPIEDVASDVLVIVIANKDVDDEGLKSRFLEVRFRELNEASLRIIVERVASRYGLHPSEAAINKVIRDAKGKGRDVEKLLTAVDQDLVEERPAAPPADGQPSVTAGKGGRPRAQLDPRWVDLRRQGWSWKAIGKALSAKASTVRDKVLEAAPELAKSSATTPAKRDPGGVAEGVTGDAGASTQRRDDGEG
jgi:hypothetical protein